MKHPRLALLIAIIALATSLTIIAADTNAKVLLQSGLMKESIEGDLLGAITQYERAVQEAQTSQDRALATKALLRLGLAYKKRGDGRARSILDQVARESSDRNEVAAAKGALAALSNAGNTRDTTSPDLPELRDHIVWNDRQTEMSGRISFDGRYLSFVDSLHDGALAIRELATGSNRQVVNAKGGKITHSAISRSGREIAYAWRPTPAANGELWVVGIDGSPDRIAYSNDAVDFLRPMDWTLDSRIVVLVSRKDGVSQIAIVDPNRSQIQPLKTFANSRKPDNMTVSSDGRFILYDAPQSRDTARDVFALSVDGGFVEYTVVNDSANDTVLGWTTDSRVLFASDRGGVNGIWTVQTTNGKPSTAPPVQLTTEIAPVRSLGTTRNSSLLYIAGTQVRSLENVLPELARMQLAAVQQPLQSATLRMGSIEGIVVKRGTNDPISSAEVELTRIEGTAASALNPGAAQAYAALFISVGTRGAPIGADLPPALAPEVRYATTGDNGRFVFRNLKPGGYRLVAAFGGEADERFLPARYGQRDPRGPGLTLPLAEGQNVTDAKIEMAPISVITGRVFDAQGLPLGHARVMAVHIAYRDGRRILSAEDRTWTDPRGQFRLFGLPPGRYVIAAGIEERSEVLPSNATIAGVETGGSPVVHRRVLAGGQIIEEVDGLAYYGDVADVSQARTVEVGMGSSSFAGADVHLIAGKARSYHIRGVLINGLTGEPASGVEVRAVPVQQAAHVMIPSAVTNSKGAFDLAGAVPGGYTVLSAPINYIPPNQQPAGQRGVGLRGAAGVPLGANIKVEVGNADVESLRITASAPVTITGRAVIEGRATEDASADLGKLQIILSWDPDIIGMPNRTASFGNPVATTTVRGDGGFTLQTRSGNYRVSVRGIPSNAYVKSMRMGEVDVVTDGIQLGASANVSLEIVVSDRSGQVEGKVVNSSAGLMANATVALVPDSPLLQQRWDLYRSANTDASGRFKLQAIPPGSYRLYAWDYAEPNIWQDAQFMEAYRTSGTSLRIIEGRNEDVQLTVAPPQRSR